MTTSGRPGRGAGSRSRPEVGFEPPALHHHSPLSSTEGATVSRHHRLADLLATATLALALAACESGQHEPTATPAPLASPPTTPGTAPSPLTALGALEISEGRITVVHDDRHHVTCWTVIPHGVSTGGAAITCLPDAAPATER